MKTVSELVEGKVNTCKPHEKRVYTAQASAGALRSCVEVSAITSSIRIPPFQVG